MGGQGGGGVLFNLTSTKQTTAVDGQGQTTCQGQRTDWTMRRTRIPAGQQEGASVTPVAAVGSSFQIA